MFNLGEEQTPLKALATDMYDNLNKINSIEVMWQGHLHLQRVGMIQPHLYL